MLTFILIELQENRFTKCDVCSVIHREMEKTRNPLRKAEVDRIRTEHNALQMWVLGQGTSFEYTETAFIILLCICSKCANVLPSGFVGTNVVTSFVITLCVEFGVVVLCKRLVFCDISGSGFGTCCWVVEHSDQSCEEWSNITVSLLFFSGISESDTTAFATGWKRIPALSQS